MEAVQFCRWLQEFSTLVATMTPAQLEMIREQIDHVSSRRSVTVVTSNWPDPSSWPDGLRPSSYARR